MVVSFSITSGISSDQVPFKISASWRFKRNGSGMVVGSKKDV